MNKDVRITGLTLRHSTNKDGFERLGYFDCSIDGVQYNGLTLARKPDGQFVAWSPLLNCIGNRKAYSFTDSALRRAIADAASEAFRRLAETDTNPRRDDAGNPNDGATT
jgi:hypothetical protein